MKTPDLILINNWHVVAYVEDCGLGSITPARLLGINLVVWRSHEPNSPIQVWQDHCPHRGVQLSIGEVADNTLICPYHGWKYNHTGKCVHIPAHPDMHPPIAAQAKTYQCQERYGLVWVCLGEPVNDIPAFPEWDDPNYHKTCTKPCFIQTSAFRVMDNAMDVAHFPYLHDGLLGDRNHAQVEDIEVKADKDGIAVNKYKGSSVAGDAEDDTWVSSFRVNHPFCQYFVSESPEMRVVDLMTITPIDEVNSVLRVSIMWNGSKTLKAKILAECDELMEQDLRILHAQQPTRLPLLSSKWMSTQGLPNEIHVRSDRSTIAYRKWLKELGVTYGVC